MREQLVALLVSKVGLDQTKAEQAVDAVLDFFKKNPEQVGSILDKLPGGLGEKLGGLLGGK